MREGYKRETVYREIRAERSPEQAFLALKRVSGHCYILESAERSGAAGRYTLMGYDPALCVACKDGQLTITGGGADVTVPTRDPGAHIRRVLAENRAPAIPGLPPFTGGLVGYFAYDYIQYAEPSLKLGGLDAEGFKDVDLMLFDKVVAFDHERQSIFLIVSIKTDDLATNRARAEIALDEMERLVTVGEPAAMPPLALQSEMRELFDEAAYRRMVEAAKRHIYEGDIFQAVLSNRLDADAEGSLFGAYRAMRAANPSPYMFYFSGDDLEIAGAAPETLVKLQDGILSTFPLAGTRPRGQTPEEDAAYERALLEDPKERAEHNMLVDLGRNDLGKICRFGSVTVDRYMDILKFSHVMHIGSEVRGHIAPAYNAVDAVSAVLPAGTLSGAPKIRACEIIDRLENNKRGIYGGAIGYLSFTGDADTCIAIRICYKKNGKLFLRSGAGIVADSDPGLEYAECRHKLASVLKAVTQ